MPGKPTSCLIAKRSLTRASRDRSFSKREPGNEQKQNLPQISITSHIHPNHRGDSRKPIFPPFPVQVRDWGALRTARGGKSFYVTCRSTDEEAFFKKYPPNGEWFTQPIKMLILHIFYTACNEHWGRTGFFLLCGPNGRFFVSPGGVWVVLGSWPDAYKSSELYQFALMALNLLMDLINGEDTAYGAFLSRVHVNKWFEFYPTVNGLLSTEVCQAF